MSASSASAPPSSTSPPISSWISVPLSPSTSAHPAHCHLTALLGVLTAAKKTRRRNNHRLANSPRYHCSDDYCTTIAGDAFAKLPETDA
ncbi:hypothetical protein C8F01DRAFT_1246757 [Mycena amicta]|nr:hypothetical protein C8F01DRAFT_1246757 [Mycena amicta]